MQLDLQQMVESKRGVRHRIDHKSRRGVIYSRIFKEVEQDVAGGAATVTITSFIPAGALVLSMSVRVTTALVVTGTPTAVGVFDGAGTWTELAVTSGAIAKDVTATLLAGSPTSPVATPKFFAAATNLVLNFRAGTSPTFTSGKIRVVMCYETMDAPKF
jgi:hypothetical protein